MANLDQELQKFKTSVMGEEIRNALVSSVTLMNNDLSHIVALGGIPGEKGDPFTYADFTMQQLEALKGDPFTFNDFTTTQLDDLKFKYSDFTPEQLALLKGAQGEQGEPFKYSDFTPEQLELLKGEKGDAFTYADFTQAQLNGLVGAKGEPFTYDDFTPEQLELLKGPKGDSGEGTGDMLASVYDTNNNGVVDNAEKVNGFTVETDVPTGAKFTDTTYAVATQTTDGLFGATDKIKLDGIVGTGVMTAAEILTEIKTVDGPGSGLDADKLDGKDATEFAPASHGVHVTFGTGVTTLTSGGAGTTGVAESLSRSDHTHTLPAYPDLAGHAGNAGIHVTSEKQTEWNQNTTDIAALYGQTGTLGANDAAARREIIDMKIKLDEMNVAEFLNKTGIGFFDIFEDTSYIDTANTTATVASGDATFAGSKVLQMKQQNYEGFTEVELAIYDMERTLFAVDVAVNNSSTINMNITPGSRTVGEKFWYNGEIYTITGATES